MTKVIKIRKGLDIHLAGHAREQLGKRRGERFAVSPDSFQGVRPKVVVHEGDHVRAGDFLFVNKDYPEIGFASPVSGTVTAVVRGDRRKILRVELKADAEQQYADFGVKKVDSLSGDDVIKHLLVAGLFGYINQLPYAVSTNTSEKPKSIFVSALRDKPLAADFEVELKDNEQDFQTGLTALSRIAKTYLGIGREQGAEALRSARDVEVNIFDGPCPAGNVGVQVNHIDPVNKGEVVWTVDPAVVIYIGRLFNSGRVDLHRRVALVGPEMKQRGYVDVVPGQLIETVLGKENLDGAGCRVVNGNVLTGRPCNPAEDYLDPFSSEITKLDSGEGTTEVLGWIRPRTKDFSVSHSYFSWLQGRNKEYSLDCRMKGGRRHIVMSGEYDSVLPMDIYPEFLIKAIIAGDIEKMEALGIYEVSPEDFALAEFVDSSKLDLQNLVRQGLDMLRKENS